MREIGRRIDRLEAMLLSGACICLHVEHQIAIVREETWNGPSTTVPDPSRAAEVATAFACSTHGRQLPTLFLHLGPADARL